VPPSARICREVKGVAVGPSELELSVLLRVVVSTLLIAALFNPLRRRT
jgi:hypothetical protein